jgi:hypothetical protein
MFSWDILPHISVSPPPHPLYHSMFPPTANDRPAETLQMQPGSLEDLS